jgi:DNA-binding NarL/FixJ family response regulator
MILDLKMPRKNGFEVLAWLRERPDFCKLPVVIFSSSEEPEDVEHAYNLGASAYLVKPSSYTSYSEVVETLKQFLSSGYDHSVVGRIVRTYHKPAQWKFA